jgi:hypothetical protein
MLKVLTPSPTIKPEPAGLLTECIPPSLERLYRWFFTAAIAVVLTAGATWGGVQLWQIGFAGTFTGVSVHAINAHGQAQIYGWVGLFIMGFGYHVLPRFWRGTLAFPRLAPIVLALTIAGILARTLGVAKLGTCPYAVPISIAGCLLQVSAITIFATQMLLTCRRGKTPLRPESGFLIGAMAWFVLMSVLDTFHTWATMTAPTRDALLWQIATWQAPLRDVQIHGLALFMILGISSRMIPAFYGRPVPAPRRGWWAVALLTAAVVLEIVICLAYRFTGRHVIAAFLMLPWIMLATGVVLQVWPWKLWQAPRRPDRSDKFIRMAYAWLALSLLMLLLMPVYQAAVRIPFSHAYYGAIRHAITVGFVSLMILGMSARFVPPMRGIPTHRLSTLMGPFLLINVGCLLRVSMQVLTDCYPPIYGFIGISALFEIAALTWWGSGMILIMFRRKPITATSTLHRGEPLPARTDRRPEHVFSRMAPPTPPASPA